MYLAIGLYTLIWLVCSLIVMYQYQMRNSRYAKYIGSDLYTKNKLSIMAVLVISMLFTFFNVYATRTSMATGGDRLNYIVNFNGMRASPSIMLTAIMQMIHYFNGTIESLYYFTTFVCVIITMLAYRWSKDATPQSFVLLCVTQYFLTTLTALKQCYASALAVLFFVLILEYRSRKTDILAIICIAIAILFHTTGVVLIPLVIIVKVPTKRLNLVIYAIALILIAFFFEPFMKFTGRLVMPLSSGLGNKILAYFSEGSELGSDGIAMSFIKGLPYYFITFYGIIKRETLKDRIANYDNYLLVVGTGAFLYFVSLYNVWLGRFVYLFGFVSFVFFGLLMKELNLRGNRIIYKSFVFSCLTVVTYRFLYLIYTLWGGF